MTSILKNIKEISEKMKHYAPIECSEAKAQIQDAMTQLSDCRNAPVCHSFFK
jgi:hypothetical protein